jgi:pilus assembly protein CpaB
LIAALVISVGITSVFYVRMSRQQSRPNTRRIVVAASALQPGTPLTAANVSEANWPLNVPLDGLIEKKEDVIGRVLIYPVGAKEPVMQRDLASSSSYGLSAKIPDGMRAMAVKTNEVSSVAGFIFPGSHVDVLGTFRMDGSNNTISRTVLQNVQVLSTGTKTDPDPNGKPETINVVTLLVTPEQSTKLVLAQNQGTIQISLRNGGDSVNPEVSSVDLSDLAGTPKQVAKPMSTAMNRPVRLKPTPPPLYTVETVTNGKVSVASFPLNSN